MKNITNKQTMIPETDVEDGILMSRVESVKGNAGRGLMSKAKSFNQLEATTLDENGLGFQLVKSIDGQTYALFNSQYLNKVAELANNGMTKLGKDKKSAVYVVGIEEDGGFLRAKNLDNVGEYLGYDSVKGTEIYNDAKKLAREPPIIGYS